MSEERLFSRPVDISQLKQLAELLTAAGIQFEWRDVPELGGAEIKVPSMREWIEHGGISVICWNGTYGAEKGLLECWAKTLREREPVGWMTAEEVFEKIKGAGL